MRRSCFAFAVIACLLSGLLPIASRPVTAQSVPGLYALGLSGQRPSSSGFDQSGHVRVPWAAELNAAGPITIEAWVKRDAANRYETLLGNGHASSYWLGFTASGKLRFSAHGNDPVDSNASVGAGAWNHVAVSYDGTTRSFYINGALDKVSTAGSGPLAPAPSGRALGIGFDADDDFAPNYFGGLIDNVRIWSGVRTPDLIQATMFQSFGKPQPGLRAEWRFDGNTGDLAGSHDGISKGATQFVLDGAVPRDLRIPQIAAALTLDGSCSGSEYAAGVSVGVGGARVTLLHTASDLWACFDELDGSNAFANVYLDVDHDRQDPIQPDDLLLTVGADGALETRAGDGSGGFAAHSLHTGTWDGKYRVCCGEFPSRSAEFRISAAVLGGWSHLVGLALSQSGTTRGSERLWPALGRSTLPGTWSGTTLGGTAAPRTLSGQVLYQPLGSATKVPVPGVVVDLIGGSGNEGEALVATATSNADGSFTLVADDDWGSHRLELNTAGLPKGYLPAHAAAPAPAAAVDARTIDFGAAAPGSYGGNVFVLGDALPRALDAPNGPYFMIVAPQAVIDDGALDAFVDFKTRLGLQVEVVSVESLGQPLGSPALRDKLRALEQQRRSSLGDRFKYVLLVGTNDVIPFAYFTPGFVGKNGENVTDLAACKGKIKNSNRNEHGVKIKISDWYYADLTSNFDSNGNGCLFDGFNAEAQNFAPGYGGPDNNPGFNPSVAVGRLPFTSAVHVRTALTNILAFERQSDDFKRRTLLAMSNAFLKGRWWNADSMSYQACPGPKGVSSKDCKSGTVDLAYLGEYLRSHVLDGRAYDATTLYEAKKADGASPAIPALPLSQDNVVAELSARDHGFVFLGGHGDKDGVYRTYWNDKNNNAQLESPDNTGASEVDHGDLLTKNGYSSVPAANGNGAIVIAAACSTGDPTNVNNFGATLLAQGDGVAWIGGLSMVNVGGWTQPSHGKIQSSTYAIAERLLGGNLRLGDAVWQGLAAKIDANLDSSSDVATALYGDPSLSYWGNGGGQSTLAAWPMLRQGPLGHGATTLLGPGVPKQLWSYAASAPAANTMPPSPIVSNNGEVVVAHGSFVDVLRKGALYQRLTLESSAWGTPALSADGTIYVLDTAGRLYAFDYNKGGSAQATPAGVQAQAVGPVNTLKRHRRWTLDLGGAPRTSPVVGADGFIAVAYGAQQSTVALVRPDGVLFKQRSVGGEAIGELAVTADRKVVVSTTQVTANQGGLYVIDFFCSLDGACISGSSSLDSTAPLVHNGAIYAGRADGKVVKHALTTLNSQASFSADGKITAGPVLGPAGRVLVGTDKGTLYSLSADLAQVWKRSLGGGPLLSVPAFAADALYIVHADRLRALSTSSGNTLWTRALGAGSGYGSVAVGYGREVYAQTSGGAVVGFGEGWSSAVIDLSATARRAGSVNVVDVTWQLAAPTGDGAAAAAAGNDLSGVLLQRSDGGAWETRALLPAGTTSFTDSGVRNAATYAYRVQLLSAGGGSSDFSAIPASVQSLPAVPQAPDTTGATAAADSVRIEWSSPAGDIVTTFQIERSGSPTGGFVAVASGRTGGEARSFVDTGLTPGTVYYYRVIASNAAGAGAPSAAVAATTRSLSLAAPQNGTATLQKDGSIKLAWSNAAAGASAVVEVSEGTQDGFEELASVGGGQHTMLPGEPATYRFRVKLVLGNAESPYMVLGNVEVAEPARVFVPAAAR